MDASAPVRPLLVTDDADLLDDLLRLTAAAGVEATVAHHAAQAVCEWARAPLVVVGTDLVAEAAKLDLEPRRHVLVAGLGADTITMAVWEAALGVGAGAVMTLPDEESRLAGLLTESAHARAAHSPAVSVIGGRGGAGASLLALALARAAHHAGLHGALIDADPLGSGLDTLLGHEGAPGDRWGDLVAREGRLNWSALRPRLPNVRGTALVTWEQGAAAAVPPAAMHAVLTCAARGADIVIADLPRALDPAADEALRRTSPTLLVVPADPPSVFAAARLVPRLRRTTPDVRAVVRENGCGVSAPDVARALGLPLEGSFRGDRELLRHLRDGGVPADGRSSPLAGFADRLLSRLVPAQTATTRPASAPRQPSTQAMADASPRAPTPSSGPDVATHDANGGAA